MSLGQVIFHGDQVLKRQKRIGDKALLFIARDLQAAIKRQLKVAGKKGNAEKSKPGEPPLIRKSSSPLKKLVRFSIDKSTGRVYVGPMIFPPSKSPIPVPNILEAGGKGRMKIREIRPGSKPRKRERYFRDKVSFKRAVQSTRFQEWAEANRVVKRIIQVNVKPRPFVGRANNEYIETGGVKKAIRRAASYK